MKNYKYYIGIDEVGRGSLAGSVCAAAVLSPSLKKIKNGKTIKDSKKLSEKQRSDWFKHIDKNFFWAFGKVSEILIDKIGIEKANFLAMEKALNNLLKKKKINLKKTLLLIDGNRLNNYQLQTINHKLIVKGDEKVPLIAAASIMAKVLRDKLMKKLHLRHPKYNWRENKGYGTKLHFKAIKHFGLSPLHRKSFLKKLP